MTASVIFKGYGAKSFVIDAKLLKQTFARGDFFPPHDFALIQIITGQDTISHDTYTAFAGDQYISQSHITVRYVYPWKTLYYWS